MGAATATEKGSHSLDMLSVIMVTIIYALQQTEIDPGCVF